MKTSFDRPILKWWVFPHCKTSLSDERLDWHLPFYRYLRGRCQAAFLSGLFFCVFLCGCNQSSSAPLPNNTVRMVNNTGQMSNNPGVIDPYVKEQEAILQKVLAALKTSMTKEKVENVLEKAGWFHHDGIRSHDGTGSLTFDNKDKKTRYEISVYRRYPPESKIQGFLVVRYDEKVFDGPMYFTKCVYARGASPPDIWSVSPEADGTVYTLAPCIDEKWMFDVLNAHKPNPTPTTPIGK